MTVPTTVPATSLLTLEGTLETVLFRNPDNGYTVAILKTPKMVTIVGILLEIRPGDRLRVSGTWTTHRKFGEQFQVTAYEPLRPTDPTDLAGLRAYLGGGLLPGVGPATANAIVDHFGPATLDILDRQPERLTAVPGIGKAKAKLVADGWAAQAAVRATLIFLQGLGITPGLAVKIYQRYGAETETALRANPWRLTEELDGIGFPKADAIAQALGVSPAAPQRLAAGLTYALQAAQQAGHCYLPRNDLVSSASDLLGVPALACDQALTAVLKRLDLVNDHGDIYLPALFVAEFNVAADLRRLAAAPARSVWADLVAADWSDLAAGLAQGPRALTAEQIAAVRMALTERVSILTGGPGCGKTTVTRAIVNLASQWGAVVRLAAPTGRAAKRLSEATGHSAQTVHRLLAFSPAMGNVFLYNRADPLTGDLIIVDEFSMMDIALTRHLLDAVRDGAHLLLVGDPDQLPAVGPGNVLRDLLSSGQFPTTTLTYTFRQGPGSTILSNAHRVNAGQLPVYANAPDFRLCETDDPEDAATQVVNLVASALPAQGWDPWTDIQVLSPMHKGPAGVAELNRRLQARLNPPQAGPAELQHGQRVFRVGDRVLQTRNDYEKEVFNGDLGRITRLNPAEHRLWAEFDGLAVEYEADELDELTLAYAMSIHKSQGAEFPVVVLVLLPQHYVMLQRNLLYTGLTRAQRQATLVGSRPAVAIAVRNQAVARRHTHLADRVRAASATPLARPAAPTPATQAAIPI